jgi:hypothetical protein
MEGVNKKVEYVKAVMLCGGGDIGGMLGSPFFH